MKKKTLYSLMIFIVLLIVAAVLYRNYNYGTVKKELTNFVIKDTSTVTKIFMADRTNRSVLLEKQSNGTWLLNKGVEAKLPNVRVLLETINSLSVKELIPKDGFNTIVKQLASKSIKVEIYSGEQLKKVYYVGGPTQDQKGTYMMLEGSATPFIMWITGFDGYLSSRYSVEEKDWKSQNVFRYYPNQISSVKIEYPRKPEDSFELKCDEKTCFLMDISANKSIEMKDKAAVNEYLLGFRNLNYETVLDGYTDFQKDSIKKTVPMVIISVTNKQGKVDKLVNYPRKPKPGARDLDNNLYTFDPEKLSGLHNDEKDFILVQYFAFDAVIKKKEYFLSMNN